MHLVRILIVFFSMVDCNLRAYHIDQRILIIGNFIIQNFSTVRKVAVKKVILRLRKRKSPKEGAGVHRPPAGALDGTELDFFIFNYCAVTTVADFIF